MTIPYFILCPKPVVQPFYDWDDTSLLRPWSAPRHQNRAGKWSKHWKSNKPTNDGIKNITTCQNNFPGDPARNCDLEKRDSILSYAVDSSSQPGHPPLQAHSQSPPGDRRPTSGLWGVYFWKLAIGNFGCTILGIYMDLLCLEVCLEVVFHGFPLVHFTCWEFKDLLRLIPWSLDASGLIS